MTAEPQVEHRIEQAKTSAATATPSAIGAAFVLTVLAPFFPIALILGVVGLLLSIVGFRATKTPGITGKGVALAALVLTEQQVENLRDRLPHNVDIPQP